MTFMQQILLALEAAGLIERNGEFRKSQPIFVPTQKGRDAVNVQADTDDRGIITALVRTNINRFVVEVRGGVVLYLNQATDKADGWWWGNDSKPLIWGSFESLELALADASRGAEDFKVVSWTVENGEIKCDDVSVIRHIVVIDTRSRLITLVGERPARDGWHTVH
jgi:hypothetical protein